MTGTDRDRRPAVLPACAPSAPAQGCDVDISLFDVALHQLGYAGTWYLNGGAMPTRQPRSAHHSVAPVQTFPTADGWIFIMCMTRQVLAGASRALGRQPICRPIRASPTGNARDASRAR